MRNGDNGCGPGMREGIRNGRQGWGEMAVKVEVGVGDCGRKHENEVKGKKRMRNTWQSGQGWQENDGRLKAMPLPLRSMLSAIFRCYEGRKVEGKRLPDSQS